MRLGIAHHFGWAVAVTASPDHQVIDRRRIELVEPGVPTAPIHTDGKHLTDEAASRLVARVRASAVRATTLALDEIATAAGNPILSLSLRAWSDDFPTDIHAQRQAPYEARADSVMYRQVLAECARTRGWQVHLFEAKTAEAEAARLLGPKAHAILHDPRAELGPPWTKDHRIALAAALLAGQSP